MKSVRVSIFILSAIFSVSVSAGDNIAVGFSPGGTAQRLILNLIAGAGKTLDVAAYEFTSRPVADALLSQSQRGVAVRLVADEKVSHGRYSLVSLLACSGVPVRTDDRYNIMHNKFIVADGMNTETGSFNYTSSAEKRNAENALAVFDNKAVAAEYNAEFERLWNESSPVTCKDK
ncbi:endonuclease [Pantoea ananatis]|uniref:phospholipase D family nuclease n=1 Tax=Pantoea ananas TaxID=553 RepID=UPI000CF4B66E|nr:phospholipase D family protein [Pantoea ananatis]PQK69574.1 endonuclease [Pantoea ananatis]